MPVADDLHTKKILSNEYNFALVMNGPELFDNKKIKMQYENLPQEVKDLLKDCTQEKQNLIKLKLFPQDDVRFIAEISMRILLLVVVPSNIFILPGQMLYYMTTNKKVIMEKTGQGVEQVTNIYSQDYGKQILYINLPKTM